MNIHPYIDSFLVLHLPSFCFFCNAPTGGGGGSRAAAGEAMHSADVGGLEQRFVEARGECRADECGLGGETFEAHTIG